MRFPGLVNDAHPSTGDLIENLVVGDMPIPVPRPDGSERFLEDFPAGGGCLVTKRAAQKAIQTKAIRQARNRLAFAADFGFCHKRRRLGWGVLPHKLLMRLRAQSGTEIADLIVHVRRGFDGFGDFLPQE